MSSNSLSLSEFLNICRVTFNSLVPLKKRHVRHNQAPFMNKQLSKAIMKRSKLRNEFLRKKSKESKLAYNKQRNFCVNLLKKSRLLIQQYKMVCFLMS